jgi:hypothetical protein
MENKKALSTELAEELLNTLKTRFEKHPNRHQGIEWANVQAKLEALPEKLWSLYEMEKTGGEPDVVAYDPIRANTFFLIVPPKAPKVVEVFVTTSKHWNPEKNLNPKTPP